MSAGGLREGPRASRYAEALYPLLSLAVILLAYAVFNEIFGRCAWGNPAGCRPLDITPFLDKVVPPPHHERVIEALSGRTVWVFVTGLNHIACLATVFVAFYLIRESSERFIYPSRRALFLLCIFLPISAGIGLLTGPGREGVQPPLFQALEATVKLDVWQVGSVVGWTVKASYAAAALVALTACVILGAGPSRRLHTEPELARMTRELVRKMGLLRTLLYFSTVFLVIVSFRFSAELWWAADVMRAWQSSAEAEAVNKAMKPVESYFSVISSTAAATNTLILAAIYLPSAFVLRRRAHRLAEEVIGSGPPPPAREKWLQEQGLSFPLPEYLPRVAALLAPLLTGPISELIGRLTK